MIWELVSAVGPSRGHDLIFSPRPSPAHWGHRSWSSPGGRAPAHPVQWVLHGAGGDPGSDSLTDARDGPPVFLREMGGEDKGHLGVSQELAQARTSDGTSHVSRLLFSRMCFHSSRAFSGPEGPRGPGQSSPPSPFPSVPPCPGSPVLLTCRRADPRPPRAPTRPLGAESTKPGSARGMSCVRGAPGVTTVGGWGPPCPAGPGQA